MKLQIEYIPTDDLDPYENNARKHTDDDVNAIVESIKEFGFSDPVGVWGDNIIVEGHGRLIAAKKIGLTEVPVVRLDHMTDVQRRAYALAHNKTAELSSWLDDVLDLELDSIGDEIDMSFFGFDFSGPILPEEFEEDDIPEEAERRTKEGEVWALGDHRLYVGDSTDKEAIESLFNGREADLYVTDPPYNIDYEGSVGKIKNDKQNDKEFREFLFKAFNAADAVLKPGGAFYIWHSGSEVYNFSGACVDNGWIIKEQLVWVKDSFVFGAQDYHWRHEPCLYGWKKGTHIWTGDRKQDTVLEYDKPKKCDLHPTMKPVELIGRQICNNSNEGDLVFDSFLGSGTTLIAAEQSGRKCYGCELDTRFADVILARWEKFTGKKAELIGE